MGEALLVSLITKLGEIALQEAGARLHCRFRIRDDVVFIEDELSTMKAFLKDAEKKSLRDEGVRLWVAQVRNEAYKVEDVLEEFLVRTLILKNSRRRATGRCFDVKFCLSYPVSSKKELVLRNRFHSQIVTIKREIEEISRRRLQYNLEGATTSSSLEDEAGEGYYGGSYSFDEEVDIVGIDGDVKQIQDWLLDECHQRVIVSVVGIGGSGKTTLVKKVYNDTRGQFDCYAWVPISQNFNLKGALQRMLEEFHESRKEAPPNGIYLMNSDKLLEKIYNFSSDKRYVLVLDDVWDVNAWEEIKRALPRKGRGRVIITTRFAFVASPVEEISHVHQIKPLSSELAWDLFCRKAFRNNIPPGCCPQHLKQTGEAMVKKCGGLPLAVVAIGGLMSKKGFSLSAWDEVYKNLDWELNHNQDLEKLNRVFLTSYNYLPVPLKYCYLYCGMFPEDYRIKTSRLIHFWVAEGIIEIHSQRTLEETASVYLLQLIDRGLLQVDNNVYNVELKACRMHDLMRDTAIHMFKKEEFGVVITNHSGNEVFHGERRVAIHNSTTSVQHNMSYQKTHSLLTFPKTSLPYGNLLSLFLRLKRLRVLDLSGSNIERLPNEVGNLIHLRYLCLRWTKVPELPTSIQSLHNLQILDIRDTPIVCFPHGLQLTVLPQLRHLLLRSAKDMLGSVDLGNSIIGSENLINLQTLSGAEANGCLIRQLGDLTRLRKLSLQNLQGIDCSELFTYIKKMQHLKFLRIRCRTGEVLDLDLMSPPPPYLEKLLSVGTIKRLPSWIGSLSCLHTVRFYSSNLKEDPMGIFAKLPILEYLLLARAYIGKKMSWGGSGEGRFPKLKTLSIGCMSELEELTEIEEGMMRSLRTFTIGQCPKLKRLPHGFQHLKALKEIDIGRMPDDFIKRLRQHQVSGHENEGEDHWMIQHVPEVWVEYEVDGEVVSTENIGLG